MKWMPKAQPHEPEDWDEDVWAAVNAFKNGTANAGQQKTVWQWLEYVTRTGSFEDITYRPGGEEATRASAYADGKKHVGLQFKKMLHPLLIDVIERERKKKQTKQIAKK